VPDGAFTALAASVVALLIVSMVFAAVALLLRLRNDRFDRHTRALTERWEPVMLEVLAGAKPGSALTGLVSQGDRSAFLRFLVGYARRLRGDERATVQTLAAPLLPELVATLGRGSVERRGLAVHYVAELGLPDYAEHVARALEDPSPEVALVAARGLFREGQERHFPRVLAQLPRFAHLSRTFLSSLLARGGAGAAPLLRDILADPGRAAEQRAIVADALTLLGDLASVPIAVAHLKATDDRELLTACLRLVRRLGHREHLVAVRPLVLSRDPIVRAAAAGACGALGGPAEVPLLQNTLDDQHYWVSLQAARGLMALGDQITLRKLATSSSPWALLARQVLAE